MKMKVLISKERYGEKPRDFGQLQTLEAFAECELSVREFADKVGDGHAWRAGLYGDDARGSVKKRYVKHASAIALDFDDCPHAPCEVAAYAKDKIGYGPNVIYATYSQDAGLWHRRKSPRLISTISDGENPAGTDDAVTLFSFRFVWFLENPIDPESYEAIQETLIGDVFAGFRPDRSTKDPSRLWLGGVLGADAISEKPMPLKALCPLLEAGKGGHGRGKREAGCCPVDGGDSDEGAPAAEGEIAYVKDGWEDVLRPRCELFRRFMDGEYVNFSDRLWLLTNLKHLKYRSHNGRSIFKDLLPTTEYPAYEGHTYCRAQLREMLRSNGCAAYPCVETFDGRWVTVPEFFNGYREEQFAVPNIDKSSLGELDEWMRGVPAMLADGRMLYIKSQTASGKTEQIVRYLAGQASESPGKIIYAAPTYQNLYEMEERIRRKCEELGTFAEVLVSPKGEYADVDVRLMRVGLPKRSQPEGRSSFLKQLYDEQIGGIFLITHSLLANLDSVPCSRVIIDENPEDSLVKTVEVKLSSLERVGYYLDGDARRALDSFIGAARESPDGARVDTRRLAGAMDELRGRIFAGEEGFEELLEDVPDGFFELGSRECRKVRDGYVAMMFRSVLIDDAVRNGVPVKILTATPKSAKLEAFYGGVFTVAEAPMAANEGRIVQYFGKSGAKGRGCEKIPALAEYIRSCLTEEEISGAYVISFKESAGLWRSLGFSVYTEDEIDIHLANNAGLDCLKGRSLIIAGKYDVPDSVYRTEACFIEGCDAGKLARQNVTRDVCGVSRKMYLIEEPTVQDIQLQNIMCMTQQAVGRARALREKDATVYVFCDVPIPEADEYRYQ